MVSNVRPKNPIKKITSIKKQKGKSKSLNLSDKPLGTDSVETEVPVEIPAIENKNEEKQSISIEELSAKYPILKDEELVKKFLNVPLNNNQKGRIRQVLKDQLKDASDAVLPDVIHSKIQGIVKDSKELTEPELRKIRILYNMLKTAVQADKPVDNKKKKKNKNKKNKKTEKANNDNETTQDKVETDVESVQKKEDKDVQDKIKDKDSNNKDVQEKINKVKGPKRYVVFVGNLPPQIEKETIMKHFKELADHILSVRIPKQEEGKKSSIAYVELKNEHSYELALSKHHSMLGTKRINVLYTTQKNSKISKTEAKSKSAKLIALQKSGKLAGSVPLNRKRSHRRAKAKRAQAKLQAFVQ